MQFPFLSILTISENLLIDALQSAYSNLFLIINKFFKIIIFIHIKFLYKLFKYLKFN
jgi:hypothetical protein